MTHYALRNKGFTLIELAIVLIIIGILLGVGAGLVGPLTKRIKRSDSREVVKAAKEAVLGFAVKYKRLPNTTEFADNIKNLDAWGNTLFYYTVSELYNPPEGNICYSPYTGFTVTDIGTNKTDIAFILLSKGENGTNDTGTTPIFQILEQSDTYDDIITYGSIPELKNNVLACAGIEIETTTLPNATEDALYTTTLIGRGGRDLTWAVQGQTKGSGGCSADSYPLTTTNDADLCLYESTGIITGTVTVSSGNPGTLAICTYTVGSFTATLSQTGMESVNKSLLITVYPQPLTITTITLPDARTGVSYSRTISGTGGKASYTWSVISGTLPPGLSLSSGGVLSGTPTAQGTYNFTVQLSDTCTATTKTFTLNVIDSCFATGINVLNSTGEEWYRRNAGVCIGLGNDRNLNVQPNDAIQFYTDKACGKPICSGLNYNSFQIVDANDNCSINWTSGCSFVDL